jgi:hypothetical protein
MPEVETTNAKPGAARLKVFISYSRKDAEFASELLLALELVGFDAFLDKQDIAPGEPWEERLASLIRLADTVVFVVSPSSIVSRHCTWEVEETARLAKRLVPVILSEVPPDQMPGELRRLNFVYFSHGRSFSKALADLADALRENVAWIREHTRLGELAQRWQERAKPPPLLLQETDLAEALAWLARRPDGAPEITVVQQAYIEASKAAAAEALREKVRLRWRTQIALGAAALLSLGAAVVAGLQWQQADRARTQLAVQNDALSEANIRLSRPISLRVAPLANQPYDVGGHWYRAATHYSGAVAFVLHNANPGRLPASGVVVNASALHPSWPSEPVFVTAIYVVSRLGTSEEPEPPGTGTSRLARVRLGTNETIDRSTRPGDATLLFMGPTGDEARVPLGETIWQSASIGVSVSTLRAPLPKGAVMLDRLMSDVSRLGAMTSQGEFLRPSYVRHAFEFFKLDGAPRPVLSAGTLAGKREVTLSVHHLLGRWQFEERPRPHMLTDIAYTQISLPGSAGSPVFDVETGEVIAIHLIRDSVRCPAEPSPIEKKLELCLGAGSSLARIRRAIAADIERK